MLATFLAVNFYIFAIPGIYFFGGLSSRFNKEILDDASIPDNYHLLNFNDFGSAMFTLYCFMIVNNWHIFTNMFVNLSGANKYYRWFFVLFYYISVTLALTTLVAFVIDMYSSVEKLDIE